MQGTNTDHDRLAIADGLDRFILWARRKAPAQMSTTRITTLDTLAQDGPMRVSDLAEEEQLTQPGMTTLINKLVLEGYAERVPDPTDGRATLVRITPAGRQVLDERHTGRTAALMAEIARLRPEHQAALAAALDALHALTQEKHT